MQNKAEKLRKEDYDLFSSMEGHYVSENEKTFFEMMRRKMEYEITVSNDLILSEFDNDDHLYILRCVYEEIVIGHGLPNHYDEECHVMTLAEALATNLKECGFLEREITLLEWLRGRDYENVRYDNNFDDE